VYFGDSQNNTVHTTQLFCRDSRQEENGVILAAVCAVRVLVVLKLFSFQVNVFLNRLNGQSVGVSILGIFVIDKNTILAVRLYTSQTYSFHPTQRTKPTQESTQPSQLTQATQRPKRRDRSCLYSCVATVAFVSIGLPVLRCVRYVRCVG